MSVSTNSQPEMSENEDEALLAGQLMERYPVKTKYELVSQQDTPSYLRVPFVKAHYRAHFTMKLCVQSLLGLHTETFNIWTHLLGCLALLGLLVWTWVTYLAHVEVLLHRVLLTLYCVAAAWLLACSTSFHWFNCCSPDMFYKTALLDYSGIGILILASQWVMMEYSMMCLSTEKIVFEAILGVFSVLVVVGPMFKAFQSRKFRLLRALMYIVLSLVLPVVWLLISGLNFGWNTETVYILFVKGVAFTYLGYGIGVFFYVSRFPERLYPGKFDVFFQSHSIWHVFVVCGALILFFAYLEYAHFVGDKSCAMLFPNATNFTSAFLGTEAF